MVQLLRVVDILVYILYAPDLSGPTTHCPSKLSSLLCPSGASLCCSSAVNPFFAPYAHTASETHLHRTSCTTLALLIQVYSRSSLQVLQSLNPSFLSIQILHNFSDTIACIPNRPIYQSSLSVRLFHSPAPGLSVDDEKAFNRSLFHLSGCVRWRRAGS